MKAEELRLGNLVYCNNKFWEIYLKGKPLFVSGIKATIRHRGTNDFSISIVDKSNYDQEYSQFIEFIDPIPLTEEWLLKFGFNKNEQNYFVHGRYVVYILANEFVFYGCDVTMCYVHQLQNLYFALTGEELTIPINM